jgi:hypothetical protein
MIKKFNEFSINEEISKKSLLTAGIIGTSALGAWYTHKNWGKASNPIELSIDNQQFKKSTIIHNEILKVSVSKSDLIGVVWSETEGSGDDKREVYYHGISIPDPDIKQIYAMVNMGGVFVSEYYFEGCERLDLKNDYKRVDKGDYYSFEKKGFSLFGNYNFIVAPKGNIIGTESIIDGSKWTFKYDGGKYIFKRVSKGLGISGGAGASGGF